MTSSDVDEVLRNLQKRGGHYDRIFPNWIPGCISSSICAKPHNKLGDSVTYVSNSTAIHEVFDRIGRDWDKMYQSRSHLHVFEQDGIHTDDMLGARNVVRYLSDQYKDYAKWEDALLDTKLGPDGFRLKNEKAALNDEQDQILEELRKLQNFQITSKDGRA